MNLLKRNKLTGAQKVQWRTTRIPDQKLLPQIKELLDRPVSKVPEEAPDKKTQTSNLPHQCNKHITIKRLREERSRFL